MPRNKKPGKQGRSGAWKGPLKGAALMRQFRPVIKVTHYGFVSGTGTHDLTEWLGDGCVVRTSKNLRAPMGQFTITFVDKKHPDFLDSVYYLFAPMDAVEIRISHDGSKAPTLVMRGFVSDVRRDESMGQDGKPSRRVTVSGCDFIVRENFTQEDGVTLSEQDVQAMSSSRTDANVSNWFWARLSRAQFYDQATARIQAMRTSSYDQRGFDPCSEARYGWRKMEVDASLFPEGHGLQNDALREQYQRAA